MSDIKNLYRELIIDHNNSPSNFGKIKNPDLQAEGFNPICGDHYFVFIKIANGKIKEIKFEGSGCAISMASASIMTEIIEAKSEKQSLKIFEEFRLLLNENMRNIKSINKHGLGKLEAFAGVKDFPTRIKCVELPWYTMKAAFDNKMIASTE